MPIRWAVVILLVALSAQMSITQNKNLQNKNLIQRLGRDYGRSMVISRLGIVATSQTLASAAGADVLREGGSAIDAAIAANAVLGVTEPMMNGIGGDLFAIVYEAKTKQLYGLNSSGWAPQGLTIDFLKSRGIAKSLPRKSIQSVTVPGTVAGWDALHQRFGKLLLERVLEPAIYYAKEGVPIAEMVSRVWAKDPAGSESRYWRTPLWRIRCSPGLASEPMIASLYRRTL
jgi:gamma-glutamyltranspeptidase/glutathione hydrolase